MHFERIKINQSTAILTGVDFIDDFLFCYQHTLFCMASSFLRSSISIFTHIGFQYEFLGFF